MGSDALAGTAAGVGIIPGLGWQSSAGAKGDQSGGMSILTLPCSEGSDTLVADFSGRGATLAGDDAPSSGMPGKNTPLRLHTATAPAPTNATQHNTAMEVARVMFTEDTAELEAFEPPLLLCSAASTTSTWAKACAAVRLELVPL